MNISKEPFLGEVLIRMIGNHELIIENHKGIHLYSDNQIIVTTKNKRIQIKGTHLHVRYFSGNDMKITGEIDNIAYCSGEVI